MATYRYTAANAAGGIRQGQIEAVNKAQAVSSLQDRGLMLMDLIEEKRSPCQGETRANPVPSAPTPAAVPNAGAVTARARWSRFERAVFLRQLALMFNSGVSLFQSLALLAKQNQRPTLGAGLQRMVTEMERGCPLSVALEKSGLFSPLQVGTVRVGESTGQLGNLLASLAQVEEQEVNFERQVVARLSYPAAVFVAVVVGVAFLGHVMGGALTGVMANLPGSSSLGVLFWMSKILASPWFVVVALLAPVLSALAVRTAWKKEHSRSSLESVLLKMPPFGPLWRRMESARLCRLLAVMVSNGVRADRTLTLVANSSSSPAARRALKICQETLQEGAGFARALERPGFFPAEVIHMAAAGEESGRLGPMLARVAHYCEVEVERFLDTATAALEPLLMAGLGLGVGAVILATFAPIYRLLDTL